MVKEDAAGGMQVKAFAVIDRDPMAIQFGHTIGAARIERRVFILAFGLDKTKHFTGRGLIKARFRRELANGFEQVGYAQPVHDTGRHRLIPRAAHKALRTKVVDFLRPGFDYGALDGACVREVAFVITHLALNAQLTQTPAGITAAPGYQSMYFIPLIK